MLNRLRRLLFLCVLGAALVLILTVSQESILLGNIMTGGWKPEWNLHLTSWQLPPKRRDNFIFVKIEKTGSSTMYFMFEWYAIVHGLDMMISNIDKNMNFINTEEYEPGVTWVIGPNHTDPLKANILTQHARFNEKLYNKYFHEDTVYLASLREPVSWFISYVDFMIAYKNYDPHQVLKDPQLFHKKRNFITGMVKHVHNTHLQWLGFDINKSEDEQSIQDYIKYLDSKFEFMLITEYFDESLIVLKGIMNWSFRDIFYAYANEGKKKSGTVFSQEERLKLIDKEHNRGDYLLYQHFNASLWRRIERIPQFWEQVTELRRLNSIALNFCNSNASLEQPNVTYELPSPWEEQIILRDIDCLKLTMKRGQATRLIKALHEYIPRDHLYSAKEAMLVLRSEIKKRAEHETVHRNTTV